MKKQTHSQQKSTGLIALDIDGTITAKRDHLDPKVKAFLEELHIEGWQLLFVTGRTFSWSYHLLEQINVPYFLACQNGALVFQMPEKKILFKEYLQAAILKRLESICKKFKSSPVIFAGFEFGERSFFCPDNFTQEKLSYLAKRSSALKEVWEPLSDFSHLSLAEFASIRIFEEYETAKKIAREIENELGLHAPLMMDSFDKKSYVVQITANNVSKGSALKAMKKILKFNDKVIACGDDLNDIPLFEEADFCVVMQNAPDEVLAYADFVAPPAEQLGIITGLGECILKSTSHK